MWYQTDRPERLGCKWSITTCGQCSGYSSAPKADSSPELRNRSNTFGIWTTPAMELGASDMMARVWSWHWRSCCPSRRLGSRRASNTPHEADVRRRDKQRNDSTIEG